MKKIIILIILTIFVINCGQKNEKNKKTEKKIKKQEVSKEVKEKIEQELSKINENTSKDELQNIMLTAIINYEKNPEIGKIYFEKLSKYIPEASKYLADYYYENKEYVNYEKYEKQAAEAGILDSIYNLGYYYDENEKFLEAEIWYKKAMEMGHPNAEYNLAIVYGKLGKEEEATKIFKKLGYDEGGGMYYAALNYRTEKQYDKAEKLYNEMIARGNAEGFLGLGQMYEKLSEQYTTFKDFEKKQKLLEKAFEMYKKGADKGNIHCIFFVADTYSDRGEKELAEKYYLMGVAQNDLDSIHNLGVLYQYGFKDYEKAKKWYKKAMEMGDPNAESLIKNLEKEEKKKGLLWSR